MALFALLCTDKPDSLDLRMATRPSHLDWIEANRAAVKLAGPFLGPDDKPNGSLFIIEADDAAAAKALTDQDPYAVAGLFAASEIKPWRLVVGGFAG